MLVVALASQVRLPKRAGRIDRPVLHGLQQHAGVGLAVGRVGVAVGVHQRLGVLAAVVDGVHVRAGLGQVGLHGLMQRRDGRLVVVAAPDPRLVGHHDDQPAGAVEGGHRLTGAIDPVEVFPPVHIAAVLVEDAVSVEEQGGAQAGVEHGVAYSAGRRYGPRKPFLALGRPH